MTDTLRGLMDKINSRHVPTRRVAARAALALPPEQLLRLIEMEARRYPYRLQRLSRPLLWGLCILVLTPCVVNWDLRQDRESAVIMVIAAVSCLMLTAVIESLHRLSARGELAEIMLQRADIGFLVSAVDMLQIRPTNRKEKRLRHTLQGMLKHSLAKLHADDGPGLSREQRDALNRLLGNPLEDVELTICVLKALQQVGDATALPAVQRLYTLPVPLRWRTPSKGYKAAHIAEIRWAAYECLPFLTAQVEKTRQAQTLLRASEAQPQTPETLLRPAVAAHYDTPAEQLLRPTPPI